MACATLKRSLEFDPVYNSTPGRPQKRRRCLPLSASPASPSVPKTPPTKAHQVNPSPFGEVSPKWCSDIISARLQDEVRRMQRRRQLHYNSKSSGGSPPHSDCEMGSTPPGSPSGASGAAATSSASAGAASASAAPGQAAKAAREQPLFTLKQVSLLCERMIKEREEKVREEYDQILNGKLAEQYDAFVKFTYDQIQRRFHEAPISYVS